MAKQNKYSKEFKLDCVKRILSGKDTLEFLSKKLNSLINKKAPY